MFAANRENPRECRRHGRSARADRIGRRIFHVAVEAVEPRTMLSGVAGTFAVLHQPAGSSTPLTIDLGGGAFRRGAGGRVLVTIVDTSDDGASAPGAMALKAAARGSSERELAAHSGGPRGDLIEALSPGRFSVAVGAGGESGSTLEFRLAGDVNGDFRVDGRDLRALRARIKAGADGSDPGAADGDGDGVISRADLRLASRNLGAATTIRPLAATAGLDGASDPNGDGVVVIPGVTIRGAARPGTEVRLVGGGGASVGPSVATGKGGTFTATATVPMGDSTVYALVTDRFGQSLTVGTVVHRRDVTIDWSNALLSAIRDTKGNPPASARQMAILGVAMYDAVDSIDHTYTPYGRFVAAPSGSSREAAAAVAAHDVLVSMFPGRSATFDATLAGSLADIPDGSSKSDGMAVGRAAAGEILALRADDGSGKTVTATIGTEPGQWRPTPPGFLPPLLPGWGEVKPFAVESATQFRIAAPPALDSPEYAADLNEVEQIGSATSTTRTPEETAIARFWADATGTSTPPGHWFRIAADVGAQRGDTIGQNARMFALVGMALADAAITCWNDKYDFDFWRPVTAIRLADTDGNAATTADPTWLPLLTTPNFPSHSSGHSTFSAAAASVLGSFFGTDDVTFTTTSEGFDEPSRTFTSFTSAAYEAGRSRVLGGIHYTFENLAGREVGTELGQYVATHFLRPLKSS